jgi:hypothetical protein
MVLADGFAWSGQGAHAASLHRLLRMLAGKGVFREVRDGEFALSQAPRPF